MCAGSIQKKKKLGIKKDFVYERQKVIVMLAAENMFEELSGVGNKTKPENDYDVNKVLEFCSDGVAPRRKIRCADGQEKEFLFDR